jgi:hypothetical protein
MDLERGSLSIMSTIEELLGRKNSGSGLESREYGHRVPARWPRGTFYPQKLTLTSLIRGGSSVGIFRSLAQATEYLYYYLILLSALSPGVYSASNRNEYQKQINQMFLGSKVLPVLRLTTSLTLSRPAMANWRPTGRIPPMAWFIPAPAKSQVYFQKS